MYNTTGQGRDNVIGYSVWRVARAEAKSDSPNETGAAFTSAWDRPLDRRVNVWLQRRQLHAELQAFQERRKAEVQAGQGRVSWQRVKGHSITACRGLCLA